MKIISLFYILILILVFLLAMAFFSKFSDSTGLDGTWGKLNKALRNYYDNDIN